MKRVRRLIDRLGPAGVAGFAVLLLCASFHVTALAPTEKALERRALGMQRPPGRPGIDHGGDPSAHLARLRALFPPAEALSGELESLYAHARASRVQLERGQYRLESQGNGLMAYRVTLPARASYAQLRQFVGRVLGQMPSTSLDALRFERKTAADGQLEAEIRITIHLRAAAREQGA